jgi:hypothetical protein
VVQGVQVVEVIHETSCHPLDGSLDILDILDDLEHLPRSPG